MIVEADPGQIGGGINHEYMALSDVGEDLFVECENGDYLADVEAATPRAPEEAGDATADLEEIATPGKTSIEDVATLLGRPENEMLKAMLFMAGDGDTAGVLMLIEGDPLGMGMPLMLLIGDGDAAAMPMPPMPLRSAARTWSGV